jgi:transcriptional regulator with XRE-family HTH domain
MNSVAKQLVQMRTLKGWEIEDFAKVVGVDSETITKLEQGLIDPQLSVLEQITRTLNCSFKIGDVSI